LTPFDILIVFILVFLLIFAIYWEYWDYVRLKEKPSVDPSSCSSGSYNEEKCEQEIERLRFLACFNYENGPKWRGIYIALIILTVILLYVFGFPSSFKVGLLFLLFIFLVFYLIESLRSYHVHRLLCSKARGASDGDETL